ncbi:MAG: lysophospholipid acyltransferase family protein [Christensenellaceae bacterium]|jgi:1-acyl-sn-glycerol-3-phosphate acyltransferase
MIYFLARVLAYIVLIPLFFVRVKGRKNYKIDSGCVVIANHTSNWDPIVLGHSILYKPVCYLAKEELFKGKTANWFLTRLNAVPVSRGKGDLKAIKTALSVLKAGKFLGVFPEGTRSKDGELLPFEQGAALMALRAGVPVLPVYIKGTYKPFRPVTVTIDPPIDLKEITGDKVNSEAINKGTAYLHDKLQEMSERT